MTSRPQAPVTTTEIEMTPTSYTRDAALRKLGRINRWMIASSVALTGVLTEVAAQAFPGKAKASTSGVVKRRASGPPSPAPARPTPLKAPAQAPSATTEAAPETAHSQESAPSPETVHESAPAQESAPAEHSAPAEAQHESAPAPAPEPAPAHESAPAPESPAPVVSGGS